MHKKSEKYSPCFSTLQSIVRDLQQLCCLRPTDIPPFSIAKLPSLFAISPINLATECGHCADRRRRRSRDPVRVRPSVRRPRAALPFLRRPSRMSMAIWPHSGLARGTLTKMDRSRKCCKTTRRYVLHFNQGKKSSEHLPLPRPCGFIWAARNTRQQSI